MNIKKRIDYRQVSLIGAIILLLICAAIFTPSLFQLDMMVQTLRNYSVTGILVLGMIAVILTGCIDLSIGSVLSFSGMVVSVMMSTDPTTPIFLLVLLSIFIGLCCGLVNGFLVGKVRIQPIIATLATMNIFRGCTYLASGGRWVTSSQYTKEFSNLASGQFGVYSITWIFIVLVIIAAVFLTQTQPGRRLYAVGSNEASAQIAGINSSRVKLLAYTIMGGLAGLCGILYSANYRAFAPNIGVGIEMDVIAICVLGGVSITGGSGNFKNVVIAFIMMTLVNAFLSMLPSMSLWTNALQGAIILVAVIVNIVTERIGNTHTLHRRVL